MDRDGIDDTIQPRTYKVTAPHKKGVKTKPFDIKHWIAFDLITSKGRKIRSFFKYKYGTAEVDLWVYALTSAGDFNKDGKTDLIFYAGDDTGDETIWLANQGNRFVIYKRKTSTDW